MEIASDGLNSDFLWCVISDYFQVSSFKFHLVLDGNVLPPSNSVAPFP